jgi:hypothetical protein
MLKFSVLMFGTVTMRTIGRAANFTNTSQPEWELALKHYVK